MKSNSAARRQENINKELGENDSRGREQRKRQADTRRNNHAKRNVICFYVCLIMRHALHNIYTHLFTFGGFGFSCGWGFAWIYY